MTALLLPRELVSRYHLLQRLLLPSGLRHKDGSHCGTTTGLVAARMRLLLGRDVPR